MTNPGQKFNWESHFLEKRRQNVSLAIQPPFFGNRFFAAAKRSRTISRSSFPSQNSITSLAKAIRCSTWKLNGRPRRRHISSSSARCSSDMRILYWSVFLATREACQTKFFYSWGNMINNGVHCYSDCSLGVPQRSQEISGRDGERWRKILMSDELGKFIHSAVAKGEATSKR